MAKTIYPKEGFRLTDLLSEDGLFLEMSDEVIDTEEREYSNDFFMSQDEMLKFLNLEEIDSEEENSDDDVRTPLGVSFDKLRSKMTDHLGNGMVMKFLKREGVGKTMQENAQVSAKYIGYFEHQDDPFDASYNHGSASDTLQLGQGTLIPGLEIALLSMKKHEISIFLIKPEYAFGQGGCPPRIPPNQEVLFIIYITDFNDDECATSFHNLSIEDRNLFCNAEKRASALIATAYESFKKGNIKQALNEYTRAAKMLEMARLANDEEENEQKKLLTRIYGNLAVCFNKENKPRCTCSAINQIPIPNAKSYFNHGRALIRLGEFQRATTELLTSKKMEPANKNIIEELELTKQLNSKYTSITECLKANCFLLTGAEEVSSEFINAAKELCETLQSDNYVLRIILPSSLTVDETNYIKELTAKYNLLVVNHTRYDKEIVFIAKPNY